MPELWFIYYSVNRLKFSLLSNSVVAIAVVIAIVIAIVVIVVVINTCITIVHLIFFVSAVVVAFCCCGSYCVIVEH